MIVVALSAACSKLRGLLRWPAKGSVSRGESLHLPPLYSVPPHPSPLVCHVLVLYTGICDGRSVSAAQDLAAQAAPCRGGSSDSRKRGTTERSFIYQTTIDCHGSLPTRQQKNVTHVEGICIPLVIVRDGIKMVH